MADIMCEKEQAAKLGTVPLSAKTVLKRLDVLAQNIKEQLIISIKKSRQSAIQLDETTTSGAIPSSWYTSDIEMNAGSEKRCCSAACWKLHPVVSTFST
ncbi:SCAN domain-containing protein 3 [Oopsacas minuta]|uniref:SCAN domain-containing protein 3 n=1 Tax=Oopsacas minuta TaxID=111878 RepID=A0AAV7JEN0_9METZ|nr:SCAN domain-containing protein 3 [Oopsacas minuta]